MTIRRGEQWGVSAPTPPDATVLTSDRAIHEWVVSRRRRDAAVRPFGLGGGDLARTVAGGAHVATGARCTMITLDLLRVDAGSETTWSTSHVICRRSWWTGEVVLAMTAEYVGDADVAPRSHPNDGKVDVLRVDPSMSWRTRRQALRRARSGSHLPHPQLSTRQVTSTDLELVRPLVVWVDGIRWATADRVSLTVEPDAYVAYV